MITKLKEKEFIIVGTNELGMHSGGAAHQAWEDFGLLWGTDEGLEGKTYAFPTLDTKMQQRGDKELRRSVKKLFSVAKSMPEHTFYLTAVGTGIAGYSTEYMKYLFKNAPENIVKCEEFI